MSHTTECLSAAESASAEVEDLLARGQENPDVTASYEDATRRRAFLGGLRLVRKSLNLRQNVLAKKLGTTQSAVSHLESGRVDPHLRTLQRYARATHRRFDFAMVDPATPTFDEDMAENLWQWVEFNMLGPLLTTIATRPKGERTLEKLSQRVRFPETLVGPILDSLQRRKWVAVDAGAGPNGVDTYSLGVKEAYTIGVSIERDRVVGVLVDLHTQVFGNVESVSFRVGTRPADVVNAAVRVILSLTNAYQGVEILGVGVTIAGVVTANTGTIHSAPDLPDENSWKNFRLEDEIQRAVQAKIDDRLLVAVENDANALAVQEYLQSGPQSVVVVLMSGAGIGLGFVTNGHIVHGVNSAAGECGHVISDPTSNRPCRAGLEHSGCLETVASARAILEDLGYSSWNAGALREELTRANLQVERQEENAIRAFRDAGIAFGKFLAMTRTLLDPAEVVLYAHAQLADLERFHSAKVFQEGVEHGLDAAGRALFDPPQPQWRSIEEHTNAAAAAASAMRHFLRDPSRWKLSVLKTKEGSQSKSPLRSSPSRLVTTGQQPLPPAARSGAIPPLPDPQRIPVSV